MDWLVDRLALLVPLWLSLSVHEWAHAWAANRLGDDTARLMGRMRVDPLVHLDPVGTVLLPLVGVPLGWAKPVPVNPSRFKGVHLGTGLLLTAAAGPLSNLVLAALCALARLALAPLAGSPLADGLLALLEVAVPLNLALAAFNLLPVPPLDGSRIVDGLVPYRWRGTWARVEQLGPLLLVALLVSAMLLACSPADGADSGSTSTWDRGDNPHGQDDLLRLNHVQVKGTHNSTHLEPDTVWDDSHRYSHPTLTEQLDLYDVRQLELDVHLREDGGWSVFHIPVIDEETTCADLADCLGELKAWSDQHGWHLPLVVWIEPKDEVDELVEGLQLIDGHIHELDDAIRAVWPEERLFTPDDLRGEHATLPEALAANGWPLLGEVRGQVLFALLDAGEHRDAYLADAPDLAGRVLFVDTTAADQPSGAMVKDGSSEELTAWGLAGFLTTTNGSGAGDDATTAAASDQAALDAGAHHVATDLAAPGGDYWLDLAPRCNPLTAPPECDDAEVERL